MTTTHDASIEPAMDTDAQYRLLREMPVFGAVPDRALDFIAAQAERVQVEPGAYFFHEGDRGETMFVLERGRVEVQRHLAGGTASLGRLGPGDCFGEMALIDLYPRSASLRAMEQCSALCISNGLLYRLYGVDPESFTLIMMNLARELSRRLRRTETLLFHARSGTVSAPIEHDLGGLGYNHELPRV